MKKQKLILETSPFNTNKFKVVKTLNTLEFKPGDWLEEAMVSVLICRPQLEVEIRNGGKD